MALACPVIHPRGSSKSVIIYVLLKIRILPMTATAESTSLPTFNSSSTRNLVVDTRGKVVVDKQSSFYEPIPL